MSPKDKAELNDIWSELTEEMCQGYIDHMKSVISHMINQHSERMCS